MNDNMSARGGSGSAGDDDIDKEMLTPADEPQPEPKKRLVKRVKPTVEGINAPKTTRSTVVVRTAAADDREQTAGDFQPIGTRLIPDSVTKPKHHIGRWIKIFIVLVILIGAAYEGYVWYLNKHILPFPQYSGQANMAGDATSSEQLYNSGTASSATSSLIGLPVATSTPVAGSSTPASPAGGPPVTPAMQLTINQTPTGYLNVRNAPSTSGQQLTQVHPGETYQYTAVQNGWYEILLPSGTSGWVTGQYVTVNK